jgi:sulfur carrier protein ThiS
MALEARSPMPVRLTLREKVFEVRPGMTVRAALEQIGVQPESVLPTRRGELLTDDEILAEGDEVRLVAVISGGAGLPPE